MLGSSPILQSGASERDKARFEIARSLARARGETPPPRDEPAILADLLEHAPPVCEPFCGSGSIPLEAQRQGLRAYDSDLNPVAADAKCRPALAHGCDAPTLFWSKPLADPFGATDL